MLNNNKTIAFFSILLALQSGSTQAASFEFDSFTMDWDTVVSAGMLFRIEERDPTISQGSSGLPGDADINALPGIIDNAFVINSNDGNNNFDRGIVSERLNVLTEVDLNFGDLGFFARGKIWQDFIYGQNTSITNEGWQSYNSNPRFGPDYSTNFGTFNPGAENYAKQGAELLDIFVYGTYMLPGEREVSFRLGRQVISWGEALLSGGGLATAINPVDAHIRSQPGFELKELFLPSNALMLQTQLTDTLSLKAYYQLEWYPAIIDPSSSYMNEFDPLGEGGNKFIFVTGEENIILGKDLTYNVDAGTNNPLPDGLGGTENDYNQFYDFLPQNCPKGVGDRALRDTSRGRLSHLNDQQYYDFKMLRCRALVSQHVKTIEASQMGQFGVGLTAFLESGAELGFYLVNYHEKIPSFILPIDAIEEFAPIIDLIIAAIDPAAYEANFGSKGKKFSGVNDLGDKLSTKQLTALLTFVSILPEDEGTIGSVTTDLNANPWKLGFPNITGGNPIATAILTALSQAGANGFLKQYGFSTDSKVRSLNYRIKYFENVKMYGMTYSTVLGTANVATELTYRQDTPLLAGDVPRTPVASNLWNWHVNTLMVFEPYELFGIKLWDFASFTAEALYWNAPGKKPFDPTDTTNKKRLAVQNSPQGIGVSAFMGLEYYNVFSGWDINVPIYVNWGIDGSQFNAGYRDGQVIFATGMAFKHLTGVEIGTGVTFMFGDTDDIFQMLTSDRDSAQIYIKYAF